MASGPSGTGWSELAASLNIIFGNDGEREKFAKKFMDLHGRHGKGGGGKTPYRFGRYVESYDGAQTNPNDKLLKKDRHTGQFLIDSGERRWDPTSHAILEEVVRHSLTRLDTSNNPKPKKIAFTIAEDPNMTTARATIIGIIKPAPPPPASERFEIKAVNDKKINDATEFEVSISCPPPPPRVPTP